VRNQDISACEDELGRFRRPKRFFENDREGICIMLRESARLVTIKIENT
jgi:hypothetical protein